MPIVEERVSKLEAVLEEFIKSVGIEFNKLYNAQMRMEAELREFKEEAERDRKAFEERAERDRKALHDEILAFKEEMREEARRRNREWSNLAKKMGTLVEDLIAPSLRPVLKKYFNCEVTLEGQRMFRRDKERGIDYEIDAIAVCDDMAFMIEVRSTPRDSDIKEIQEKAGKFFEFFPEFRGKELIPIFGSIVFPENIIKYASREGIYVMGWREWEYMDILNFDEVKKKRF